MAVIRGSFVTIGQIAFYEQVKQLLLASGYFKDNVITHFTSSFAAGKLIYSKNIRKYSNIFSRCRCNFINHAIRCDENSIDERSTRNI